MSIKPKSPCYGCEERDAGCHSKCEKYADWKKEIDVQRESERTLRNMDRRDFRQEIFTSSKKNKIVRERKK